MAHFHFGICTYEVSFILVLVSVTRILSNGGGGIMGLVLELVSAPA